MRSSLQGAQSASSDYRSPSIKIFRYAIDQVVRANGIGILVGCAGVFVLFHNLIGKPISATLWGNDLDPYIITWTVEWVYHTVFERLAPLDVWNANSYFPYINSLAFSDSLFSLQL